VRAPVAGPLALPTREERDRVFDQVDFNRNGTLSLAEIDKAAVEIWPQFNHKKALMRAYKAADVSGDGFIGRREFRLLCSYIVYFNDLWHKFDTIDRDHDHRVSLSEFRLGCQHLGLKISAGQAAEEFGRMDRDGGGFVIFDEFCAWCARRHAPVEAPAPAPEPEPEPEPKPEQELRRELSETSGLSPLMPQLSTMPARDLEPEPRPEPQPESAAESIQFVQRGTMMSQYAASGKRKNERFFWMDGTQLKWAKKMNAQVANKQGQLAGIVDGPGIKDAAQWFRETDSDSSGELDQNELAQLYRKATGEKLGKKQLAAAMREMDTDGGGTVSMDEFEQWWSANGGDLEQHRSKALTVRLADGVELRLVAPNEPAKRKWVDACTALLLPPAPQSEPSPKPSPKLAPQPKQDLSLEADDSKHAVLETFMHERGLGAWQDHMQTYLKVQTPQQLQALTATDLLRLAKDAEMAMDQPLIKRVLKAIALTDEQVAAATLAPNEPGSARSAASERSQWSDDEGSVASSVGGQSLAKVDAMISKVFERFDDEKAARDAFARMDVSRSRTIDAKQLSSGLHKDLGLSKAQANEGLCRRLVSVLGGDADGLLTAEDFAFAWKLGRVGIVRKKLRASRGAHPEDDSTWDLLFDMHAVERQPLTLSQFVQTVRKRAKLGPQLMQDAELKEMFRCIDTNGDGRIDRDEFRSLLGEGGLSRFPRRKTREAAASGAATRRRQRVSGPSPRSAVAAATAVSAFANAAGPRLKSGDVITLCFAKTRAFLAYQQGAGAKKSLVVAERQRRRDPESTQDVVVTLAAAENGSRKEVRSGDQVTLHFAGANQFLTVDEESLEMNGVVHPKRPPPLSATLTIVLWDQQLSGSGSGSDADGRGSARPVLHVGDCVTLRSCAGKEFECTFAANRTETRVSASRTAPTEGRGPPGESQFALRVQKGGR